MTLDNSLIILLTPIFWANTTNLWELVEEMRPGCQMLTTKSCISFLPCYKTLYRIAFSHAGIFAMVTVLNLPSEFLPRILVQNPPSLGVLLDLDGTELPDVVEITYYEESLYMSSLKTSECLINQFA